MNIKQATGPGETAESIAAYLKQELSPIFRDFKFVAVAGRSIGSMHVEVSFYQVPATTTSRVDILNAPVSVRVMISGGTGQAMWEENSPPPGGEVVASTLNSWGTWNGKRISMRAKRGPASAVALYVAKWFKANKEILVTPQGGQRSAAQRIASQYIMTKTAAPLKKGSNLYRIEGGKIKTWVIVSVGAKNTRVRPGKTIPANTPRENWLEETLEPDDDPGRFRTNRDRGGTVHVWYSDLEDAREQLFRSSLQALKVKVDADWGLRGLKPKTLIMMAEDYGIPVDEGLLKASPE
jgi:hypothetical protein